MVLAAVSAILLFASAAPLPAISPPAPIEAPAIGAATPIVGITPPADATTDPAPAGVAPAANDATADMATGTAADSASRTAVDAAPIVVTARAPGDPLEKVNVASYKVTQEVDDAVVGPAARAYKHAIPGPIRDGLRNFFRNLREPMVALNDLLQLHPGRSVRTLARFAVNSTVGGAGLFDMARRKPFDLPRHPNSFADTLGYYGVKPGPYLFLPLIGPTTVRDMIGGGLDRLAMPIAIGGPLRQPAYTASAGAVSRLDRRARADVRLAEIRAENDPYEARRQAYLYDRQAEIDALHTKGRKASAAAFAALDPVTVR